MLMLATLSGLGINQAAAQSLSPVIVTDVSCPGANNGVIAYGITGNGPFTYQWSDGDTGTYSGGGCAFSVTLDNTGAPQTDFQIPVVLNLVPGMNPDFSDVRFVDAANNPYTFWLQDYPSSSTATFWVLIPSIPSGTFVFYANFCGTSTTSTSDPWTTFDFFDDFDDGDISDWTAGCERALTSGEYCNQSESNTQYWSPGYSMHLFEHGSCFTSPYDGAASTESQTIALTNYDYVIDYDDSVAMELYGFCSGGTRGSTHTYADGVSLGDGSVAMQSGSCGTATNGWNYVTSGNFNVSTGSADIKLMVTGRDCANTDGWIDNVRIRRWSPDPINVTVDSSALLVKDNLAGGTYTVTITDVSGSVTVDSVTVNEPPHFVDAGADSVFICTGGFAQLNATGGFYYNWMPATGLSNDTIANPIATPATTTTYIVSSGGNGSSVIVNGDFEQGDTGFSSDYVNPTSNPMPEGTYIVASNPNPYHAAFYGTDHTSGSGNFMTINGSPNPGDQVWCQTVSVTPNTDYAFSTWITTVAVGNPALLQFTINGVPLGSTINAPIAQYQWDQFYATWNSGSATSAVICIENLNTNLGGNDFGLDDIEFATLCVDADTVTVVVNPVPAPNLGPDDTICPGASLTLDAGAGFATYDWSTTANTQTINVTNGGTYSVSVTDSLGCPGADTVAITGGGTPISISSTVTDVLCYGDSTGGVQASVSGGYPAYTYNWDNGDTTNTLSNVAAGNYALTVTDDIGCTDTASATVGGPAAAVSLATNTVTDVTCFGLSDGAATVTVAGGVGSYVYTWNSGGSNADSITGLQAGNYSVTVADANGCEDSLDFIINEPTELLLSITDVQPSCTEIDNGSVTADLMGGTLPFTYSWSNGDNTLSLANVGPGTYMLVVTDSNGCTVTDSATVAAETMDLSIALEPDTVIEPGTSATFTASSSNIINTILWSPGAYLDDSTGTIVIATPEEGIYTYTAVATNANGCSATDSVHLTVLNEVHYYIPNAFTPNGDGRNDYFNIELTGNVEVVYFWVYDRWGERVFQGENGGPGWDGTFKGKPLPPGVYVYHISIQTSQVYSIHSGRAPVMRFNGSVTLIR